MDLIFEAMPQDADELTASWLGCALESGADVAWFGFEGSFDFEHLLTADVAEQIYAVAGPTGIHVATDHADRASDRWIDLVQSVGRTLAGP